MSCIVADAGPLIALAKAGLLELPRRAFGQALISRTVFDECLAQARSHDAQRIREAVDAGVLVVCDAPDWPVGRPVPRLDPGELSAIALALHHSAPLLMDEKRGRRSAAHMGIPLVGVCGLLVIARRQRWISNVHDVLTAMKRDGYYIAPSLVHKVLQLAGEE
jgi:hypothetical protein